MKESLNRLSFLWVGNTLEAYGRNYLPKRYEARTKRTNLTMVADSAIRKPPLLERGFGG